MEGRWDLEDGRKDFKQFIGNVELKRAFFFTCLNSSLMCLVMREESELQFH